VDEDDRVVTHGVHGTRVERQRTGLADLDAQAAALAPLDGDEDGSERWRTALQPVK
jgi:hypothetical protein